MARTRSGARQLAQFFASSQHPIYVLDERRRLIYVNAACATWLGVEADQLQGVRCDFYSGEGRDPLADFGAALCPPPEVFSGQRRSGWVHCRNALGKAVWREGDFLPLGGNDADSQSVIAVLAAVEEPDGPSPENTDCLTAGELHDGLRRLAGKWRSRFQLEGLAGESVAVQRLRQQVRLAVDGQPRVLIVGPPGSGREHVARTIHCGHDPQTAGPLMPLSCSLLDAELLQTTVLAFLRRCQDGPSARPASLLLLEIDQLSAESQAELLAFFRIPTFGLRTIVTASRPLLALADEQTFSRELAQHLSVQVIELPSLAERRRDIPFLAQQFLEEQNARNEKQLSGFTPQALDQLASMPWPGNLEELTSVVQQACESAAAPWITEADLPRRVQMVSSAAAHPAHEEETIVLDDFLSDIERELIQRALKRTRGNKTQAARLLGIHRARLLRRLSQLGLESAE